MTYKCSCIITYLNTLQIVVSRIITIQKVASNIWNVLPSITLTRNINLVSLQAERVDEILPEPGELIANINLIIDKNISGGVSSTNRLIDPDHVGQISP